MKTAPRSKAKSKHPLQINWSDSPSFSVPIPKDEPRRLATLHKYQILDTPPEEDFDELTTLAAEICGTPIALVTLVDSNRQWFKSKVGIGVSETSRDVAFCAHAIMQRSLFVVADASKDRRFARNPLVLSNPKIRFYAGMPLLAPNNQAMGTLCVIDRVPRKLTLAQTKALRALSQHVMRQMETRRKLIELKHAAKDSNRQIALLEREVAGLRTRLQHKDDYLQKLGHEIRTTTNVLLNLEDQMRQAGTLSPLQSDYIALSKSACHTLLELTREIVNHAPRTDFQQEQLIPMRETPQI